MTLRLNGSTSGYVEIDAPAVAGAGALTLPTGTGTIAKERQSATASIATRQTTTSTSYTDLATSGPTVTLTTGTKALVIVTFYGFNSTGGAGATMAFAVSGATTISAVDDYSATIGDGFFRSSAVTLLTTLSAGSNTFTSKYKANGGGTATFDTRAITVIDLGS